MQYTYTVWGTGEYIRTRLVDIGRPKDALNV